MAKAMKAANDNGAQIAWIEPGRGMFVAGPDSHAQAAEWMGKSPAKYKKKLVRALKRAKSIERAREDRIEAETKAMISRAYECQSADLRASDYQVHPGILEAAAELAVGPDDLPLEREDLETLVCFVIEQDRKHRPQTDNCES